jgi:hypothetical protein
MNNDLDDWLNSLGLSDPPATTQVPIATEQNETTETTLPPVNTPMTETTEIVTPVLFHPGVSSQPISNEDFNSILTDNGFQEPEYEEAEEILDDEEEVESSEEEGVNTQSEEHQNEGPLHTGHGLLDQMTTINPTIQAVREFIDIAVNDLNLRQFADTEETQDNLNNSVPQSDNTIPLNSPTLLIDSSTARFSGAEWYNEIQKQRIIVAGCGGIGSWTILQLARMTPTTLVMYDDDVVEQVNMAGQLYCKNDIGKAKVDAMVDMINSYTTMRNIYAIKRKFTESCEAGDVMICGFDNMAARKTFFEVWLTHVKNVSTDKSKCLFIDGRLSIDTLQVLCIQGNDDYNIDRYQKEFLFSDREADETQCSLKQTTYLACMIGSFIVNLFTNFVANTLNPIIPYDLPFFTEYDAQNMIFKTVR